MSGITLPPRPRNYRITLTPLADAMFQLLIFFMLSTSLTPYSLMTLRSAAEPAPEEISGDDTAASTNDTPQTDGDKDSNVTVWTLGEGTVTFDDQDFDISQVTTLADALGEASTDENVVLLITPTARVQDLSSAIEALQSAEISNVKVLREDPA